ncbi:uncharacterized protein IAS62_003179 [Cryptococcus decagattii]|uniref:RNA polymerase I-specific transcription initiation factor RRN7 n=1 Tax=Cryptococcus decagattii TaxID=1859122 RepID=A0ABZ2AUD9_9TREE
MARKCPVCGSTKWKRDRITGSAICEDGHVLQDFRSELHVVDGAVNYALTRRRLAKAPRYNKRKMEGRKNQEFFHGPQAEILKLQAFQLLLRHQVHALRKLWNLPDAFEMIVKDLWTYQLLMSTLPELPPPQIPEKQEPMRPPTPPPIPYNLSEFKYVFEEDGEQDSDDEVIQHPDPYQLHPDYEDSDASKSESDDEDGEREEEPDVDPEIIKRLEESDKEEEVDQSNVDDKKKGDTRFKRKRPLRASDTITTLVVALWIIRVPIMGLDVERLISTMAIPFIDFGHTTYIPDEMKKHMNKDVMQALTPSRSPNPVKIHDSCRLFARMLKRKYGVEIPPFNLYPVSWRIISCLGGNPTIHHMTIRLLRLMKINFRLITRHTALVTRPVRGRRLGDDSISSKKDGKRKWTGSPGEDQRVGERKGEGKEKLSDNEFDDDELEEEEEQEGEEKDRGKAKGEVWETYERTKMMYDELPPEVSIAAAWVIVMKMIYGLDGQPRKAIVYEDPVVGLPQEAPWLKELCERFENGLFKTRDRGPSKELNFISMPEDELDAFLNKSEEILLDHRAPIPDASRFPLPPFKPQPPSLIPLNTWAAYHSSLLTIPHTEISSLTHSSEPFPLTPGEKIRSYSTSDRAVNRLEEISAWKDCQARKRSKLERKKKIEEARMAKSKNMAANGDGLPARAASNTRANDKATKNGRTRATSAAKAPNRRPSHREIAPSRATSTASIAAAPSRPPREGRATRTSSRALSAESGPYRARTRSQTACEAVADGQFPTPKTSVAATPVIITSVIATPKASKTNSRVRSVSPTYETPKRPKILAAPKSAKTSRENSRARSGTPSSRPLTVRTRSMTSLVGEL